MNTRKWSVVLVSAPVFFGLCTLFVLAILTTPVTVKTSLKSKSVSKKILPLITQPVIKFKAKLKVQARSVQTTTQTIQASTTFQTIWGDGTPAGVGVADDTGSVEVGLKFSSSAGGVANGVRFYKYAENTGTHVGELWTEGGQVLASTTFSNETASGWQEALFSRPVTIQPNTVYVISYHASAGHYSFNHNYFDGGPFTNDSLKAINSLYSYGAEGTFPQNNSLNSNYWVDVAFTKILPPPELAGDINRDGAINKLDYDIIDAGFLSGGTLTGYDNGDLNGDGKINFDDYYIMNTSFLRQAFFMAPTNLGALQQGNAIKLTWTDPFSGVARGYSLERKTDSQPYSVIIEIPAGEINEASTTYTYTDSSMTPAIPETYTYRVRARGNSMGVEIVSKYSNEVPNSFSPITTVPLIVIQNESQPATSTIPQDESVASSSDPQ